MHYFHLINSDTEINQSIKHITISKK